MGWQEEICANWKNLSKTFFVRLVGTFSAEKAIRRLPLQDNRPI
jgi:hypothetical protein